MGIRGRAAASGAATVPASELGSFSGLSQQALSSRYCITCHNERLKTGGLALDTLALDRVEADAETWEKVVRKVRAGLMPPAGAKRPTARRSRRVCGRHRGSDRSRRRRTTPTRADAAASHEPRRVRQRDTRPALAGGGFLDAASGRRLESRLRQHRRRAGRLAIAARALRVGGGEDQQAGRRESATRRRPRSPTR